MKRILVVITVLLCADIAVHFVPSVHAQATGTPASFSVGGAHTACTPVVAGATWYCFAADGIWKSINGAAYVQVDAIAGGVTTFKGRTGDVLPAANDYSFAQLSAPPTSFSCVTGNIPVGSSTPMSGSGCIFK